MTNLHIWKSLSFMGIFDRHDSKKSIDQYLEQLWEYQEAEANLMVEIATMYYEDDDPEEAINYLEKAVEIYGELEFSSQEAAILDLIGDVYLGMQDNNRAIDSYRKAYKIYTSISDPSQEEVLEKIDRFEEELDEIPSNKGEDEGVSKNLLEDKDTKISFEPAQVDNVEIGEKLDDIIMLIDEAAVNESYKNLKNPLKQLSEAYEMSSSIGDEKGQAALLLIMGEVLIKEQNTNKALDSFKKALKIYGRLGYQKGEAISLLLVGATYFIMGDTDTTSNYINEALSILKDTEDIETESAANNLFKALSK